MKFKEASKKVLQNLEYKVLGAHAKRRFVKNHRYYNNKVHAYLNRENRNPETAKRLLEEQAQIVKRDIKQLRGVSKGEIIVDIVFGNLMGATCGMPDPLECVGFGAAFTSLYIFSDFARYALHKERLKMHERRLETYLD